MSQAQNLDGLGGHLRRQAVWLEEGGGEQCLYLAGDHLVSNFFPGKGFGFGVVGGEHGLVEFFARHDDHPGKGLTMMY